MNNNNNIIIIIIIVITGGCIIKAISNFFKKIFLVFGIILGKDSGVFLEFNIELIK